MWQPTDRKVSIETEQTVRRAALNGHLSDSFAGMWLAAGWGLGGPEGTQYRNLGQ